MAEAVKCDMASPDWLKWQPFVSFRALSVSKNESIRDCAGERPKINSGAPRARSTIVKKIW